MRRARSAFTILATLALAASSRAQTPEIHTINWYLYPLPPVIFRLATHREGISQTLISNLQKRMPGVAPIYSEYPVTKLEGDAAHHEPLCTPTLIETASRRDHLLFSRHKVLIASNRLFVRRDLIGSVAVGADGSADIAGFAAAVGSRLGLVRGRSYGQATDAALGPTRGATLVNDPGQIVAMYGFGRIDSFIGLPHEVFYFGEEARLPRDWESFALPGPVVSRQVV